MFFILYQFFGCAIHYLPNLIESMNFQVSTNKIMKQWLEELACTNSLNHKFFQVQVNKLQQVNVEEK